MNQLGVKLSTAERCGQVEEAYNEDMTQKKICFSC